jgi:hypothetical protein
MGIRFESRSRPATAEEAKRFEELTPVKLERIIQRGKDMDALFGKGRADFDNDGTPDQFLCVDRMANTLGRDLSCIIKNPATGGWSLGFKHLTPKRRDPIRELRVGDINGDGRIDIVIRLQDGGIRVYENTSDQR